LHVSYRSGNAGKVADRSMAAHEVTALASFETGVVLHPRCGSIELKEHAL